MHFVIKCYSKYVTIVYLFEACVFVPVSNCPCTEQSSDGCNLPECSSSMSDEDLCEADSPLPGGSLNYNVNNCPNGYDVFECVKGKNDSDL